MIWVYRWIIELARLSRQNDICDEFAVAHVREMADLLEARENAVDPQNHREVLPCRQ